MRRWVRGVVLVCVLALPVVVASPAAAASAPCADTMLLGIRGSDQAPGYGREVQAVVERARAMNPQSQRLFTAALVYPARRSPYSKDAGYHNAYQTIESWSRRCPRARIALVGYSQGAHIAGDLANTIARANRPVSIDRVVGVILIADPAFNPSSHGAQRIKGGFGSGMFSQRARFPVSLAVRSVCIGGDFVCDSAAPIVGGQLIADAFLNGRHHQYATTKWPNSTKTIPQQLGQILGNNISLVNNR